MSDIGYNDNVQVYGRKFHVQTATQSSKGMASCEVFEAGRVINKNYISFERRGQSDEEQMENRIRKIVENMHQETLSEIELMFAIAKKIKSLGHAPSHVKMGLLFVKNNLMQDAVNEFKTAIEINPKQIDAYNNLGLAHIKAKDYAESVKVFERALLMQPGYADVHHNLGMAYFHEKQHHKGLEHIQKALRINPEYQIARYNQAMIYMDSILSDRKDKKLPPATIRVERAIQQLQVLVDAGLDGALETLNKVKKALIAKDFNNSIKILESAREKLFPDEIHSIIGINFYLRFMYGGKNLTKRSLKKFEQDLINSIESNDEYADLWNNLGIVHLIQCRNLFLKALGEFNKALEINPKFEKALKNKKLVENDGKEFLILLRAILK
ncbi:MAG: tetratricopeptide repeat protein [Calditrichaeota bacterium]|nr:MAG: tetratricopeptide repeat protein [Calditrichota bacterium]MBL1205961.1 tetratricopeptide repeat protein [Calditrichota bacterium]NOG45789.1 tetratricopeptide repeat protein [Calditrichota bacterium]